MSDLKTLQDTLITEFGKRGIENRSIPRSILGSLNPSFELRPYQETAFKLFTTYWHEWFYGKPRSNHQLLFHMATGSGKTLIMAGLIAYLYEQGYRDFLFFVNSGNIINKTRDNFLNSNSSKYLFNDHIEISGKMVSINEVASFQSSNKDDINIVFTTVQGLHMSLNTPRENSITYDDFEDRKIVLISDEAHHINADTKKGNPTQTEMFEKISWESTVEKIFKSNIDNVLLEFSATIDLSDENLNNKYTPKLVFNYPLKAFRGDGYSKEVKVLQADLTPIERALQAVILSQYRRKVFEKNRQLIKPVLMLKSKTIDENKSFYDLFVNFINAITAQVLLDAKNKYHDTSIINAFNYFNDNQISLENLADEIKIDFSEDKLLLIDSNSISPAKQLAANSLEDNNYRVVFAVDMLNEGWDVLNLFDIVRLYDTRDAKGNKVGKTTMSEAQLIGRGARYCPFKTTDDQALYARKFDHDIANELRVCEELYYHCAHNPRYIQELNSALREIGMKPDETVERELTIKPSFKSTNLYKGGHIFLNKRQSYDRSDIDGLDSVVLNTLYTYSLHTGQGDSITVFDDGNLNSNKANTVKKDFTIVRDFGVQIIRKAIQVSNFYTFSNLKSFFPQLKSIEQFITSDKYLAKVKIEITATSEQLDSLSADDKLKATLLVLDRIQELISSDKVEYKGSYSFEPRMIKEVFTDKKLNYMSDIGSDKQTGRPMINSDDAMYRLDLASCDWYVFNDCYGSSEEKLLVQYVNKRMSELQTKFSEVYLIRNESHFKIFNFDDGQAFAPDFVLYLIGKEDIDTMHYQVFIEPKGGHLLLKDAWKERFLSEIKTRFSLEHLFSGKKYVMWGLPFYNSTQRMPEFEQSFNEVLA